eukprot:COSAG02_NODE_45714_length_354_cov_1.423529_2_plen_45_part_01
MVLGQLLERDAIFVDLKPVACVNAAICDGLVVAEPSSIFQELDTV